MQKPSDEQFFKLLHDYLCVYAPIHRRLSEKTIRSYKQSITRFVNYLKNIGNLGLREIGFDHCTRNLVYKFLVWLRDDQHCSNQTLNLRLCALKAFLKYCAEADVALTSIYLDIASIHAFKNDKKPGVEYLSEKQLHLLFSTPDSRTRLGRRDRFFMILTYELGTRLQETLDLKCSDIADNGEYLRVRIKGKGAKVRYVPLMPEVTDHLSAYMAEFHPDGIADEWVFFTRHDGKNTKMGPGAVDHFMKKYAKVAHGQDDGFPTNLHAHMLRHSIAMAMYKKEIPISYIRDFLGHASVETTSIYSHADDETIRRSLEAVNHESAGIKKKWKSGDNALMEYCGLK